MAYEKQNFTPKQKLKASELNHIEDGIVEVEESVAALQTTASKLQPIVSTTDIAAGSAASDGRSYHVIE